MRWVIRTENLTKYYGTRRGVEGLSLDVEPGEIFGFLGLNGAGKTTTIQLLLDLVHPTNGWASVLGMDSRRFGAEIRKQVGYQTRRSWQYPHWTVEQVLRYWGKQSGGIDWPYTHQLISDLDLDPGRRVFQLSNSEKQKIRLAQAFMQQNKLLILDEPLGEMDDGSHQVFYHLVTQARAAGCTVFLTTDSLVDVERFCDRVAILHQGNLLGIDRGVHLRGYSMRKIEIRFSGQIAVDVFRNIPNLQDIHLEDNILRCTICGDPDALIKAASQFKVCDIVSRRASLDELLAVSYGCPN